MYFGRQYLNSEFYSLLKDSDFRKHLVLILGEDSEGNVVGGTINVVKVRARPARFRQRRYLRREDTHVELRVISRELGELCSDPVTELCVRAGGSLLRALLGRL
jgi:hypothetical protein